MIDRSHGLPLARQARAVGISRGSVYYRPRPVSEADFALMRRIDALHLEHPFAGSRMLRDMLWQDGVLSGRRHVATLMRRIGIEALYRRPSTSRRHPHHPVYPYLLRGIAVTRPNQVWAMDITYIPMARGFVYLAAVMDWHSRRVLAWPRWTLASAWRLWRRLWPVTAGRRSSTPTRGASSRARPSPDCSRTTEGRKKQRRPLPERPSLPEGRAGRYPRDRHRRGWPALRAIPHRPGRASGRLRCHRAIVSRLMLRHPNLGGLPAVQHERAPAPVPHVTGGGQAAEVDILAADPVAPVGVLVG